MPHFAPTELVIVLLIVFVLFGGSRVAKLDGELGTALREIKRGRNAGEEETQKPGSEPSDASAKQL